MPAFPGTLQLSCETTENFIYFSKIAVFVKIGGFVFGVFKQVEEQKDVLFQNTCIILKQRQTIVTVFGHAFQTQTGV